MRVLVVPVCIAVVLVLIVTAGCKRRISRCVPKKIIPATIEPPPEPACDNEALTRYKNLLVFAPHPDDETLGFAGLIRAYRDQGKPVQVVVSTDGDSFCEACRFWKSGSVRGETCSASDLSNFATPAIDSFAEVRRQESTAAASILGLPPPTFLGYPDASLNAAWDNFSAGQPYKRLRRSDFGSCADCNRCKKGYGGGPETPLTASTLLETLDQLISSTSEDTLLATTHWLDSHGDHSSLGKFVMMLNAARSRPQPIAFAVIHATSRKDANQPDCWYPGPSAVICPCDFQGCATREETWIANLRAHRFRPDWPGALPDDADYGEGRHLCLPEKMYLGESATKTRAVLQYKTQLGLISQKGTLPEHLAGILDCSGYLISFVRRTEPFVLVLPPKHSLVPAD